MLLRLAPNVDPKFRRQILQETVRPIVSVSQERGNHYHQQARTHQQPNPQPLY